MRRKRRSTTARSDCGDWMPRRGQLAREANRCSRSFDLLYLLEYIVKEIYLLQKATIKLYNLLMNNKCVMRSYLKILIIS